MTDSSLGSTVLLGQGVEVRSSGHAPVGVVSELVDMEAMLAGGQSRHLTAHFDGARLGLHTYECG